MLVEFLLIHQNLKLTFSPLKNSSWKMILSFWGPACFQGPLLFKLQGAQTKLDRSADELPCNAHHAAISLHPDLLEGLYAIKLQNVGWRWR